MSDAQYLDSSGIELRLGALSRFLNVLILINGTTFVLTGLVRDLMYYYPIIALALFFLVEVYLIIPCFDLKSKKLYWGALSVFGLGIYFTLASIVYFVQQGHFERIQH